MVQCPWGNGSVLNSILVLQVVDADMLFHTFLAPLSLTKQWSLTQETTVSSNCSSHQLQSQTFIPHMQSFTMFYIVYPLCFNSGPSQYHLLLRSLQFPRNWSASTLVWPFLVHSPHRWLPYTPSASRLDLLRDYLKHHFFGEAHFRVRLVLLWWGLLLLSPFLTLNNYWTQWTITCS